MTTTDTEPSPPSGAQRVLLRNYYEHDFAVDGVTGGETIPLRVRRFTHEQLRTFLAGWSTVENPPHERAIYRKADESGLDMAEVRRRRVAEMTDEARAAFTVQENTDVEFNVAFCREQVRQHIWVAPSAKAYMEDEAGDTRPIKTGEDLVTAFGGNVEMLLMLTGILLIENTLGAQKKRNWRSRLASTPWSSMPKPAADGPRPDATVTNADGPASANNADVSADLSQTRSIATT